MYLYHCEGQSGVIPWFTAVEIFVLSHMLPVLLLWLYTLFTLYCLIFIDMFYIHMQLTAETESVEWICMYVSVHKNRAECARQYWGSGITSELVLNNNFLDVTLTAPKIKRWLLNFLKLWNPVWDDHPGYFHCHASKRTAISPKDSSEKHNLFTTVSSLGRNLWDLKFPQQFSGGFRSLGM
jgi:hypothetical protein